MSRETGENWKNWVTSTIPWKVLKEREPICLHSASHHQGNTSTPHYSTPWVTWPAEAWWDDIELISRSSLSLKISPAICFPNVNGDATMNPAVRDFKGVRAALEEGLLNLSMSWGQMVCGKHNRAATSQHWHFNNSCRTSGQMSSTRLCFHVAFCSILQFTIYKTKLKKELFPSWGMENIKVKTLKHLRSV